MPTHPTSSGNEAETIPVACTLNAADLAAQAGRWEQVMARTLTERTEITDGVRLGFRDEPGVEDELRQLADAESRCCPWATWTVRKATHEVVLVVRSTGAGIATLHAMFTESEPTAGKGEVGNR